MDKVRLSQNPEEFLKSLFSTLPAELNLSCDFSDFDANSIHLETEDENSDSVNFGDDISECEAIPATNTKISAMTDNQFTTNFSQMLLLRQENKELKLLLAERNQKFHDLAISEQRFVELRSFPAEKLSTYDLACLRTFECVNANKKETESNRLQLQSLSAALEDLKGAYSACQCELQVAQRMIGVTNDGNKLEYAALNDFKDRQTRELLRLSSECQEWQSRALRCDELSGANKLLQDELSVLRVSVAHHVQAAQSAKGAESATQTLLSDCQRSLALVEKDKMFLAQELQLAQSRADDKSRQAEQHQSRSLALELKMNQLTDQLLAVQLHARTECEDKLTRDLHQLRADSSRELETIKQSSRELSDRENRVLVDARALLQSECDSLRRKCDMLGDQNAQLTRELAVCRAEGAVAASEMRAELQMKSFELTSLGAKFEERMSELRQAELHVDVLRLEVEAHKIALLKLENDSTRSASSSAAEMAVLSKRLASYEALEQEIDQAVLRSAQKVMLESDNGEVSGTVAQLLQSVKGVPSNPERRVRQAVQLAQQLLDTEKLRDEAVTRCNQLQAALKQSQQAADVARENMTRATQPASYLVGKLRQEEQDRLDLQAKYNVLEKSLESSTLREQQACNECDQLRARLKIILQQRSEIDSLTQLLTEWQSENVDEEDEEEEEEVHHEDNNDDEIDNITIEEEGDNHDQHLRANHIDVKRADSLQADDDKDEIKQLREDDPESLNT